jgi:hypothetical protein
MHVWMWQRHWSGSRSFEGRYFRAMTWSIIGMIFGDLDRLGLLGGK